MAVYDMYGVGLVGDHGVLDVVHDRYEAPLALLLPNGPAWPRDDETLQTLVTALTVEFSRISVRSDKLGRELDPATTFECVTDWEESYGLPDCAQPNTLAGRRAAIAAKLLAQIGHDQSLTYWVDLFAAAGYTLQYIVGGKSSMSCTDDCMDELLDEDWTFVWTLVVDSGADDALLECIVNHNALIATLPIVHYQWTSFSLMLPAVRGLACTPMGYIVGVGDGGLQIYTGTDLDSWSVAAGAPDGLNAVCAVSETLIAVGAVASEAQVSVDGGATWSQYAHGTLSVLYGVSRGHAADDSVAVAVGAAGTMLRTIDAGLNWTALAVLAPTKILYAVTRCTGAMVAVGEDGTVLRSVDNGATWAAVAAGITATMRSVTAWGLTVVAVGSEVWRSADAGAIWEKVYDPTGTLYAVTSSPAGRWTACGSGGLIVQSRDDGVTWTPQTSPTTDELFAACAYLPGGRAVLAGDVFVLE